MRFFLKNDNLGSKMKVLKFLGIQPKYGFFMNWKQFENVPKLRCLLSINWFELHIIMPILVLLSAVYQYIKHMPDIIVLIFIVISANITYMYILLDQKEGKLFVETKALENSTNGALYLVISPLLVHVVNLSVSDCQLRLKSLTKLIIFLSWLYIKHMTDRIVLIFIFWLILDFDNLKIRKLKIPSR